MRPVLMLAVLGLLAALAPRLSADEKSPAERAAAEWLYPDAKVVSASKGGSVSCVVQETADDVSKVLKHYEDKLGLEIRPKSAAESGVKFKDEKTTEYAYARLMPEAAGGTAAVLTFKTGTAVATLIVCRSADGKATTVTITHVPLSAAK